MAYFGYQFAVVEFGVGSDVTSAAAVPHCWLKPPRFTQCYWPPKLLTSSAIKSMVTSFEEPHHDWELHEVRVLAKTDAYSEAVKKAEKALYNTDCEILSSDVESTARPKKRRIVPPARFDSDVDSEEIEGVISRVPKPKLRPTNPTAPYRPVSLHSSLQEDLDQCPVIASTPTASVSLDTSGLSHSSVLLELHEAMKQIIRRSIVTEKQIREILGHIKEMRIVPGELAATAELPDIFPIHNEQEMEKLVELASQRTDIYNQMVQALKVEGGDTPQFARRTMSRLLTNKFAGRCNLSGRGGKVGLKDTVIFKAVFDAARLNDNTKNVPKKEMEAAVRCWLTNWRDREGGCRREAAPKEPSETSTSESAEST